MSDLERSTTQQTTGGGGQFGTEPAGNRGDFEFEPVVTEGPSGRKPTGLLIMLLVVGLAIGSLFSMHTLTKVSASSGRSNKIEEIVEKWLSSPEPATADDPSSIEGYEDVLHHLTNNNVELQVKDLKRNPFDPNYDGDSAPAASGSECERAADRMVLKSVMGGTIANINGRIVRVGSTFPVEMKGEGTVSFLLKDVGPNTVTVECAGSNPDQPVVRTLNLKRGN